MEREEGEGREVGGRERREEEREARVRERERPLERRSMLAC